VLTQPGKAAFLVIDDANILSMCESFPCLCNPRSISKQFQRQCDSLTAADTEGDEAASLIFPRHGV
jgi:hypothetical protein